MVRNIIGSVLAVIGAASAVASPFQAWYNGRHGRDYRVEDLFNGITGTGSDLWVSLLLPFVFAALVTLIGLVLRSRLLVTLAGVVVLGFTILWMVRQGQAAGSLSLTSDGSGLGLGVAAALGGGALLLIAAAVMSGRTRRRGGGGGHRYVGDRKRDGDRDQDDYRDHGYDPDMRDEWYGDERLPPVQPPVNGPQRQDDRGPEQQAWDTGEQPWAQPPPDDTTRRPPGN
ncbi:hypothetical protein [Streptomyces sp. IB2014 016-6]|uniref:hypothetical protein n=1 Tax=Streptomyces sp. IB2014 016-6 TaxID=2517818 RepID=UPI001F4FEDFC|nr:hypothetical protein [Streptomyces sp. IB2014 016-6]